MSLDTDLTLSVTYFCGFLLAFALSALSNNFSLRSLQKLLHLSWSYNFSAIYYCLWFGEFADNGSLWRPLGDEKALYLFITHLVLKFFANNASFTA